MDRVSRPVESGLGHGAVATACFSVRNDGRISFMNEAGLRLFGAKASADLVGGPVGRLMTLDPADQPMRALQALSRHSGWVRHQATAVDGSAFEVELAVTPFAGLPGHGFMIEAWDAAERRQIQHRLRVAATVIESTAEAIMILDPAFRLVMVNAAFTRITGYRQHELAGGDSPLATVFGWPDPPAAVAGAIRSHGRWEHEGWSRRKNGETYAQRVSIIGVRDEQDEVARYVVVFADVTRHKLDEEKLRRQANYDLLTGLPNRSLFMDRLNQSLHIGGRAGQRVGLLFVDLDGFKLINDTLGHDVGDRLLEEAGKRLAACVRHGDTVARLGGDEFAVIMPNLGENQNAPVIAQRMIETLEQPFLLDGHEASLSASIGIATSPDDAGDALTLLKHAESAMYRAKEQGKAGFQFFTVDLNQEATQRLIIKSGLSRALDRDEFTLHYQPKCDLSTGRVTGVEALLRWRTVDLGMVPPIRFIPVMEETGLISTVGDWVLEMACLQHKAWRDAGFPQMRVAVNLSVRQLRQPNLVRTVERILARTGIEPGGLELEITESMIMRDTENAVTALRSLSEMGIRLAMDDFGTGYSSLSYLKRLPLHTIKIDRSFISDIATDPDDLAIIRTIISMGHSLRRRVVAEGVETIEQRDLLRRLRCDEMQGYLLSPPVPAPEIDRMLTSLRHGNEV